MTPYNVMEQALNQHNPVRIFAMFSGGNDSIVSTHFAMEHGAHEVLHINTGIGIKETREFIADGVRGQRGRARYLKTCRSWRCV